MAKQITGRVISDKGDKTIVISVRVRRTHPIYKKQYTVSTKFMAHDGQNQAKVGDLVIITETKPLSSRKRFVLKQIIESGGARFEEADAVADVAEEVTRPQALKPAATTEPPTKVDKPKQPIAKTSAQKGAAK